MDESTIGPAPSAKILQKVSPLESCSVDADWNETVIPHLLDFSSYGPGVEYCRSWLHNAQVLIDCQVWVGNSLESMGILIVGTSTGNLESVEMPLSTGLCGLSAHFGRVKMKLTQLGS